MNIQTRARQFLLLYPDPQPPAFLVGGQLLKAGVLIIRAADRNALFFLDIGAGRKAAYRILMCGRFTQAYTWSEIHDFLDVFGPARNLQPR